MANPKFKFKKWKSLSPDGCCDYGSNGFSYYSSKSFENGPMKNHDYIMFVIHMDAAAKEMVAENCFDIIEENTQINRDELQRSIGTMPKPPDDLGMIAQHDPDPANRIIETTDKAVESWLKRHSGINSIIDRHNLKLKMVYSIMLKYFGHSVLQMVSDYIDRKSYFEAWHSLVDHYLRTDVMNKQSRVTNIINSMILQNRCEISPNIW
jgi:hypothetical protein